MWPIRSCKLLYKHTSPDSAHITLFLMLYAPPTLTFFHFHIHHSLLATGPFHILFLLPGTLCPLHTSIHFAWVTLINTQISVPASLPQGSFYRPVSKLGLIHLSFLSENCLPFFIALISDAFHSYWCDSFVSNITFQTPSEQKSYLLFFSSPCFFISKYSA